jgi:type II secretory pathway pseudopilin PulG
MTTTAQPPSPEPALNRRALWQVRIVAIVTLALMTAAVAWDDSGMGFFLAPLGFPYLVILGRLMPRSQRKKGLALAISMGAVMLVIAAFVLLAVGSAFPQGSYPRMVWAGWVGVAALMVAAQVAMISGAIQTYHSLPREPLDGRTLRQCAMTTAVLFFLYLVLAGMAIPSTLRSRTSANESSAVGALRSLNTAAATYAESYPKAGFPEKVSALGPPAPESQASPAAADLLDARSACADPSCLRFGYRFTYTLTAKGPPGTAYTYTARPVEYGRNGHRSFFTDQSGIIRGTGDDRAGTAADPPLQ